MSIITNVFHIYGFLITEEAATAIQSYAKEKWEKNNPKLFQAFSAEDDISLFQEYLVDTYEGFHYENAEYMSVWSLKDHEELDLDPGNSFYILELKNFPELYSSAYASYEDILDEFQEKLAGILPPDLPWDSYLVEIMGEIWG